jgi:hypothetical protein
MVSVLLRISKSASSFRVHLNVSSSQSLVWSAKNLRGFSSSTADAATYRVFGSYSQQDILQSAITIPISGILTANFFGADRQNPVTGGLLGVNGLAFYDGFDGTVFGPDNIQSFSFHAHHDLGSTLSLSIGQFDQPGNPAGLLMQSERTAGPDGVREPRPHHSNGIECPDETSGLSRLRRNARLCHHASLLSRKLESLAGATLSRRGHALVILLPVHHRPGDARCLVR